MYLTKLLTPILILLFLISGAIAQNTTLQLDEVQEFRIDGDANVRSWDADITQSSGQLVLSGVHTASLENLTPESFGSLEITIPVAGIESDTGRLTRNLQGYLKINDHPEIFFTLNSISSINTDGNSAVITAEGIVNAAGQDNPVTMTVNAAVNENGSITFSGTQELLMTDFDIDPPTAVLGTIRARDEISIVYQITFTQ